jgi:hypothetical protein
MFDIPEKYTKNEPIEPKTFIQRDMKKAQKDRIKENLLEARLVWQIAGEEVSSLVNDRYNCTVIMGLDVRLKEIKGSAFFAELVQHMIKAPCVIRFYDHKEEVYSFAHKRLSKSAPGNVVIEDRVEAPALSTQFADKTKDKLKQYLAYGALLNKTDKLSLYLEAMVKAFIISHPKLYSGIEELLDRKLWYNRGEVLVLLDRLNELVRLNAAVKMEKLPGERAKLLKEIKTLIEEIK